MDLMISLERCRDFLTACPHPQKVEFSTAAKARKRARQIGGMSYYECICGKWHLTSKAEGYEYEYRFMDVGNL